MTIGNQYTWNQNLNRGSGLFDLRLEIEGFPYDFVTNQDMTGRSGSFAIGTTGYDVSNFFYSTDQDFVSGSGTMTRVAMVRVDGVPAANQFIFSQWGGGAGWVLYFNAGANTFSWQVTDGAGNSNTNSLPGNVEVGKTYIITAVYSDADNDLNLWVNDVEDLGATGIVIGPRAGNPGIGARAGGAGSACEDLVIIGVASSDSAIMTGTEALAYNASCLEYGDVLPFDGCEHLYSARSEGGFTKDQIGNVDLIQEGTAIELVEYDSGQNWTPKTRLLGLKRMGINDHVSTMLTDRRLDTGNITFEIVDVEEKITNVLATTPNYYAELAASINSTQTTITVQTGSLIPSGTLMHIGKEAIRITSQSSPTDWTVVRGQHDSVPHAANIINQAQAYQIIPMTDTVTSFDSRRVRLFAYGKDDDLFGTGSIVWRGNLVSDFKEKEGMWTVNAAGVSGLLEQQIGSNIGETKLRGFWFHSLYGELAIAIHQGLTTLATNSASMGRTYNNVDSIVLRATFPFPNTGIELTRGFWETPSDLAATLNEHCQTTSSLAYWTAEGVGPMWSRIAEDGTLAFQFRTPSAPGTTAWPYVQTRQSPGFQNYNDVGTAPAFRIGAPFTPTDVPAAIVANTGGTVLDSFNFSTGISFQPNLWKLQADGEWQITDDARDNFANSPSADTLYEYRALAAMPAAATIWRNGSANNRLYIERRNISDISVTDVSIVVENPSGDEVTLTLTDPEFNEDDAYITGYRFQTADGEEYPFPILITDQTEINLGYKVVKNGSFIDFLEKLTEQSKEDGFFVLPNLSDSDFDFDDMKSVLSSSNLHPSVVDREFSFYKGEASLNDVIEDHLMWGQFVWSINPTNRKLTIRRLQYASANQDPEALITTNKTLTQNGFPGWERSKEHLTNIFNLKTGWNPIEEEHTGRSINAVFAGSVGIYKPQQMEIAMQSRANVPLTIAELNEYMVTPLSVLAYPYIHITIDVPFLEDLFNLTIGSIVAVSAPNIPNIFEGTRGVTEVNGTLLGMDKDYENGIINLHIWSATNRLGGYTPSARVLGTQFVNGTTFDLSFDPDDGQYSPGTIKDYQWYEVGDRIRMEDWNLWDPVGVEGTITQDIGGDPYLYRVEFDPDSALGSFTTLGTMRYINYSGSNDQPNEEQQQRWCYVSIDGQDIPINKFAL